MIFVSRFVRDHAVGGYHLAPRVSEVIPNGVDTGRLGAGAREPGPMDDPKELQELSAKSTGGSHPGVLFLATDLKDPGAAPKLVSQPGGIWAVSQRLEATAKGQKGTLVIGLTLVGVSPAA